MERVPASVAREKRIMPVAFDGETLTVAALNAADIGLADKLRFILNKNIRLVAASEAALVRAINFNYGRMESKSVDSLLAEEGTDADFDMIQDCSTDFQPAATGTLAPGLHDARMRGGRLWTRAAAFRKGKKALPPGYVHQPLPAAAGGLDGTPTVGGSDVFFLRRRRRATRPGTPPQRDHASDRRPKACLAGA